MSAGAVYNPWGNRRISGRYYGVNYDYTLASSSSEYGIYGGFDFSFIGSPENDSEILEGIRWAIDIDSDGICTPQLTFTDEYDREAFRLRIYVKNLGTDCFPNYEFDFLETHASALARNRNWAVDIRTYTYSAATSRQFHSFNKIGDFYTGYQATVPAGTVCVQISAWPQTGASARFTEAFQLLYGYEAVQDNGESYVNTFGQNVSNFFTLTGSIFNNAAFSTILGVFVGGCIVVLVLKMGVTL